MLTVRDLGVSYGGSVLALRSVAVEVSAGAAVAVLGSNGAGKTTLLRAVSGVLAEHDGAIEFEGRSLIGASAAAIVAAHPDQPKSTFVMYGYAQGQIMERILDAACQRNDLTRAGLLKAFQSLKDVQTDGLVAQLSYGTPGQIPARQIYLVRPDAGAEGGLTQVGDLFAAPLAMTYQPTK